MSRAASWATSASDADEFSAPGEAPPGAGGADPAAPPAAPALAALLADADAGRSLPGLSDDAVSELRLALDALNEAPRLRAAAAAAARFAAWHDAAAADAEARACAAEAMLAAAREAAGAEHDGALLAIALANAAGKRSGNVPMAAALDAAPAVPMPQSAQQQGAQLALAGWAPRGGRLSALLTWQRPGASARAFGAAAYCLLLVRWAQSLEITPLGAAAHAALLWLAFAFVRRRVAWALGAAPPPPPPPLAAREAAVRAFAARASARAAAAASRAAPLLAEAWALAAALFSGAAPDVTLRLALALWLAARVCAAVALRPWGAAVAALLAAFTLPPAASRHAHELALLRAAAGRALAAAAPEGPRGRAALALAAAWLVWACSGAATRAFLAFLALVAASDAAGRAAAQWQAAHSARQAQTTGGCTLREIDDVAPAQAQQQQPKQAGWQVMRSPRR
jgi:hypothetical protein